MTCSAHKKVSTMELGSKLGSISSKLIIAISPGQFIRTTRSKQRVIAISAVEYVVAVCRAFNYRSLPIPFYVVVIVSSVQEVATTATD